MDTGLRSRYKISSHWTDSSVDDYLFENEISYKVGTSVTENRSYSYHEVEIDEETALFIKLSFPNVIIECVDGK